MLCIVVTFIYRCISVDRYFDCQFPCQFLSRSILPFNLNIICARCNVVNFHTHVIERPVSHLVCIHRSCSIFSIDLRWIQTSQFQFHLSMCNICTQCWERLCILWIYWRRLPESFNKCLYSIEWGNKRIRAISEKNGLEFNFSFRSISCSYPQKILPLHQAIWDITNRMGVTS